MSEKSKSVSPSLAGCTESCAEAMLEADENFQKIATTDRRSFIKSLALGMAAISTLPSCSSPIDLEAFFQRHFKELDEDALQKVIARLEKKYKNKYQVDVHIDASKPLPGVLFGYGLDITRCIGCRRCVYACVKENNQSRDPQIHWIRVFEMEKGKGIDLEDANVYYEYDKVPQDDKFYFPVACQHCEDPACTRVCPTKATWKEDDGIVVIDYDWCIGCRYCMAACPYGARHFNWAEPSIPSAELNPNTHYLGNRPREKGVVEKCSFCIQRVRKGLYPACVEACPVGARKFGNLLDPTSEIRQIMAHKRTYILKAELNTHPKFFYFIGGEDRSSEEFITEDKKA